MTKLAHKHVLRRALSTIVRVHTSRPLKRSMYRISRAFLIPYTNCTCLVSILRIRIRVEVRVYVQKVKHLEYEHQNNLKSIAMDGEGLLRGESDLHG